MKIFISYARENRKAAETLSHDFAELGHQPWWDKELVGGHEWWDSIVFNIRTTDLFVCLLSKEWLQSPPCRDEHSYAKALVKRILPIVVADAGPLPADLGTVQYVDYRGNDKQAITALNKALLNLPAAVAPPSPLPQPPPTPVGFYARHSEEVKGELTPNIKEQHALVDTLKEGLNDEYTYDDAVKLLRELSTNNYLLVGVKNEVDTILKNAHRPTSGTANKVWTPPVRPDEGSTRRTIRMVVAIILGLLGVWIIFGGGFHPFALLFGGIFLLIAYFVWR